MTDGLSLSPEWGETVELNFNGHPIGGVLIAGIPWFLLSDLPPAIGLIPETAAAVDSASFPSYLKATGEAAPDPGEGPEARQPVTLVSPLGVYIWTEMVSPARGEKLAAWAKRTALQLCPDVSPDNKAMFLHLDERNELPPFYPRKYSGRRAEYYALRDSDAYLYRHCRPEWRPV